jgi:hypothetical protein
MTQIRKGTGLLLLGRSKESSNGTNSLPFHTLHAIEALHGGFRSMIRQPPGGIHGAEV